MLELKIRSSNSDPKSLSEIGQNKDDRFDFSNKLSDLSMYVKEKVVPGNSTIQNHQFPHEKQT